MRGIIFSALILCLFAGAPCLEAATSSKEALLIANNDYTRLPRLPSPRATPVTQTKQFIESTETTTVISTQPVAAPDSDMKPAH